MSIEAEQAAAKAVAEQRSVSGLTCPQCNGGQKRERSLTVFPKKGSAVVAVAHCWRQKCGYTHEIVPGVTAHVAETWKPVREPLTHELTERALNYLRERFRLQRETLYAWNVTQWPHGSAVYMPAYSVRHEHIGGVLRHLGPHTGSKAVIYQTRQAPFMAFYLRHPCKQLVLVEDQLSAMRAWQLGVSAAALAGVALSDEKLRAARLANPEHLTIALDADATSRAIRYALRYPRVSVARLWRDLKDSTDEEITKCLNLSSTF